jgi:hypothetical protein
MRSKGIHVYDRRPCFLTTAHTDGDLAVVMTAFKECIAELQTSGFLDSSTSSVPATNQQLTAKIAGNGNSKLPVNTASTLEDRPPQPGAKLGRDRQGNPAWFIPDPDRAGKYLQVETHE